MDYSKEFAKLGNTSYKLFLIHRHYQPTALSPCRKSQGFEGSCSRSSTRQTRRHIASTCATRKTSMPSSLPKELRFNDNVANNMAISFYMDHGVEKIEPALETAGVKTQALHSRYDHPPLHSPELGMCKKEKGLRSLPEPCFLKGAKKSI